MIQIGIHMLFHRIVGIQIIFYEDESLVEGIFIIIKFEDRRFRQKILHHSECFVYEATIKFLLNVIIHKRLLISVFNKNFLHCKKKRSYEFFIPDFHV